jgi:hypothetical protein
LDELQQNSRLENQSSSSTQWVRKWPEYNTNVMLLTQKKSFTRKGKQIIQATTLYREITENRHKADMQYFGMPTCWMLTALEVRVNSEEYISIF